MAPPTTTVVIPALGVLRPGQSRSETAGVLPRSRARAVPGDGRGGLSRVAPRPSTASRTSIVHAPTCGDTIRPSSALRHGLDAGSLGLHPALRTRHRRGVGLSKPGVIPCSIAQRRAGLEVAARRAMAFRARDWRMSAPASPPGVKWQSVSRGSLRSRLSGGRLAWPHVQHC